MILSDGVKRADDTGVKSEEYKLGRAVERAIYEQLEKREGGSLTGLCVLDNAPLACHLPTIENIMRTVLNTSNATEWNGIRNCILFR